LFVDRGRNRGRNLIDLADDAAMPLMASIAIRRRPSEYRNLAGDFLGRFGGSGSPKT